MSNLLSPPIDSLASIAVERSDSATPLPYPHSPLQRLNSPVVPDEFCKGNPSLRGLYEQLRELLSGPVDDELGTLQPTDYALSETIGVLESTAYALMADRSEMPLGCLTTDDVGGLRIEWWSGDDCVVILAIGADTNCASYVFSRFGQTDNGRTEQRVLPFRLAKRLKRLSEAHGS